MELPAELKIGGMVYSVRVDPHLSGGRQMFGEMHPLTQQIVITGGLPEHQQEETLLHEVIEAINGHCELNLRHQQIQTLGFMLHQVLRENGLRFG